MKPGYITSAILLAALMLGCKEQKKTETDDSITNFQIVQTVKSAERNYICKGANAVFADSLPIYSKVTISVQWPDKMGDHDITSLQDSLMAAIYAGPKGSIDESILAELSAPEGNDIYKMERIDTIPWNKPSMILYRDKIASAITFSPHYIVYQVMTALYDGGAHGMSVSEFINYDFDSARVITPQLAFKPGSEDDLLNAIKGQLMRMYGVRTLQDLDKAGIFSNQIFVSPRFYLQGYNVVFYYNPYDIAPYSTGYVEVPLPYYTIKDCLTPEVLRFFSPTDS